jgi:polar amino acid transport system substrate-binding protein
MLRRRILAAGALAAALVAAGCAQVPTGAPAEARAALAPTGTLRVAVYPAAPAPWSSAGTASGRASPTISAPSPPGGLGVPVQYVEMRRAAEVFDVVKSGQADLTFTNASEARQREADFTPPLVRLESGYLVAGNARITDIAPSTSRACAWAWRRAAARTRRSRAS